MLQQALCTDRLLPVGTSTGPETEIPIPEPHSTSGRKIALICHDLRLPLTAILANAEFLTESDMSQAERNELYQEIRRSIARINEMVNSLYECSKDRETFRPTVRNIVETVDQAIRMTRARPEFQRITIKHHHRGAAVGWFDPNLLEQAIANLILNACEAASPYTGLVVITTMGSHADLQIGVWDNGPGIHPMLQDSIFQPFVSFGKAEGRGLGLAIVKKIVEDHGGDVSLDKRCGAGALFKISIPFAIPLGAIPMTSTIPIPPSRTKGSFEGRVQNP